jgi:hypothetical protein
MIDPQKLIAVLEQWEQDRESFLDLIERNENMRCAIALVAVLVEAGVYVPVELMKRRQ